MKIKILILALCFLTCFITAANDRITMPKEMVSRQVKTISGVSSKVKKATLESAVRVVHADTGSYGSGSYILFDDQYVILTAAHVVSDNDEFIIQNGFEKVSGNVVYRDDVNDIAFLKVQQMKSRTALKYKVSTKKDIVGQTLLYAGYPNSADLFLFFGNVAGYRGDIIMMHSYAWMGASGSVVLDLNGRIVGVLNAIDVGYGLRGPQLVEDMIWVANISKVNLEKLRKGLIKKDVNIHKKIKTN
tara:strand:+ start:627 stop:1361 length:735 start_codon:yes stop_codon:yes gene_type:complete